MHLKLVSLLGLFVMIGLAWACSLNRKQFPWRTVWAGLALQFVFAAVILKTTFGGDAFKFANDAVSRLLKSADEGARLVFGPLANSEVLAKSWGPENTFIFVITVTATIILVSAI